MLNEKPENPLPDQNQRAAYLNTDIHLELHTRIAQSLFKGSWKHGKMGLLQFATLTTTIWNAAKRDGPYAEWYLLKSYQALFDTREKIKLIEVQFTSTLNNIRGIEIKSCMSTKPMNYPLRFPTPFGYMGAYLIADVDYVLRQCLMLERIGIPMFNEEMTVKKIVSYVQNVFAVPRNWRHTGVTRKDIVDNNQQAQQAKEQLGDIPETVVNKKINFSFLPKIQENENEKRIK